MFKRLKRLLRSEDNKPVTVTTVLMRDSCSRLLGEFADNDLKNSLELLILSRDHNGDVHVATSESLEDLTAVGLLGIATSLISGNGHAK